MKTIKGDKLVRFRDKRIATLVSDWPYPYGIETMIELSDDETGEAIKIRALDVYRTGWQPSIPCFTCKGWAPFSNWCDDCKEKQNAVTLQRCREAIMDPKFSHARARQWCRQWSMHIYHRDPTSPTGVRLVASGPEQMVEPMLKEHRRPGALSPTEGLGR